MPGVPLLEIILTSQILNGLLLPVILVFMALLIGGVVLVKVFGGHDEAPDASDAPTPVERSPAGGG